MIGNRPKTLYTLVAAAGSYIFFGLQFFVDSDSTFNGFSNFLKAFHIDISKVQNKHLAVAFLLFPAYVLIVWMARHLLFDAYARLTVESRLKAFTQSVDEIARYHRRKTVDEAVEYIRKSKTQPAKERVTSIANTMIDLLITDLRDAFQELCLCADIRIAIYSLGYPAGGNRNTPQLYMRNTTEFNMDLDNALTFSRKPGSREFQGFCGKAWDTRAPQGGTYQLLPFLPNSDFVPGSAFDKTRSFLCLPIVAKTSQGQRPIAIICIDSGRRYDFAMDGDLRGKIAATVSELHSLLIKYIRWPE